MKETAILTLPIVDFKCEDKMLGKFNPILTILSNLYFARDKVKAIEAHHLRPDSYKIL